MNEEMVLNRVKKVSGFVIGLGIAQIVWSVVDAHTPQDKVLLQEIPVTAAKFATAAVIADVIEERINDKIDAGWLYFKTEIRPQFRDRRKAK